MSHKKTARVVVHVLRFRLDSDELIAVHEALQDMADGSNKNVFLLRAVKNELARTHVQGTLTYVLPNWTTKVESDEPQYAPVEDVP